MVAATGIKKLSMEELKQEKKSLPYCVDFIARIYIYLYNIELLYYARLIRPSRHLT